MEQHYIKLRGAIFAESGYCLGAPRLRKGATGLFSTLSDDGKVVGIDEIAGMESDYKSVVNVTLRPYPNPVKAREALTVMCNYLGAAADGDEQAREAVAVGWKHMVFEGLTFAAQDRVTQFALMKNLYGEGRVMEDLSLNREVAANCLGAPDAELVVEGLGLARV